MGGRQAHGRPLLQKPAGRKKSNHAGRPKNGKNGRVDVLALAEKQVGESKTKGMRRRDLDIERDPSKRRRGQDDEDAGEAGGVSKRRRRNEEDGDGDGDGDAADNSDDEMQSDSDGNEWHIGVGSDDDDSEIDSDEAFGESDDEMFDGYVFRGSSSAAPKKKAKRAKGGEDDFEGFDEEENVGDDGESLGEEAIDLAEALDQVSDEEPKGSKKGSKKGSRKEPKKKHGKVSEEDSEDSEDDEDSEDSEDNDGEDSSAESSGLSDSDDASGSSASESESDSGDDSDLDDENLEALKSIASAFAGESKDSGPTTETTAALSKVSLADLGLTSIRDPQIKKSVKMLAKEEQADTADKAAGKSKKLDVPLSRMQQDELLRVAAAGKAHETLDRWVDTVKQNRRAEHISFPVAGSLAGTGLDAMELRPITQKTAQTELEKTIMSIMEESGLGPSAPEPNKKKAASEEEEKKTLSPDELKQLVNQRRRDRELQSRETARAKRIKKIKSKAYRRVHRREKARNEAALAELEEGEEVDSEEEREAQHRQRAMERMGSRHRESKWAKRAKHTGRAAWDDDFRSGLVDMARRDEELRRRVEGRGSGDEEGSEDDDDDEEDEEAFRVRMQQQLQQAGEAADDEPRSALMNIPFMKKAELARKKANDEAVAEIMRDLDGADDSDEEAETGKGEDDGNWTVVGRRTYGVAKAGQASEKSEKTSRAKARQAAADQDGAPEAKADTAGPATASWGAASGLFHEDMAKPPVQGAAGSWAKTARSSKKKEIKTAGDSLQVDQALAQLAEKAGEAEKAKAHKTENAVNADDDTSSSGSDEDEDRQDSGGGRRAGRLQLHDTDLLIKALGDDGAAAEFAREKARLAAEEAEAAEAEASRGRRGNGAGVNGEFLPGWGSWAGEGIRKRAAPPAAPAGTRHKKAARQDAKLERVIISERRVHKNGKYLASQLPHEFETKNQYERSLRLPVGPEWGTKMAFQEATKPRVLRKQGVVLPMARPAV